MGWQRIKRRNEDKRLPSINKLCCVLLRWDVQNWYLIKIKTGTKQRENKQQNANNSSHLADINLHHQGYHNLIKLKQKKKVSVWSFMVTAWAVLCFSSLIWWNVVSGSLETTSSDFPLTEFTVILGQGSPTWWVWAIFRQDYREAMHSVTNSSRSPGRNYVLFDVVSFINL